MCPTITIEVDNEGWPVGVKDAGNLAETLLASRTIFAEGETSPLWKLLPPHVGNALAHSPPGKMVKSGSTWWAWLANGSIMVRRGQAYGHLCRTDRRLVEALAGAGFSDIGFPNSSGSIASAILINHTSLPNLYRGDIPREVLDLAHQCDKGGRMESLQLGTFPHVYCYDYTSAYAAVLADLPDARRCVWLQSREYAQGAHYGFIRCQLSVPTGSAASPVAFRALISDQQRDGEGLRFVTGEMEVSLIKPEYDLAVSAGCRATILEAWWGYPENADRPFSALVHRMFALRQQHPALSGDIKLLMNAMIGQMSSSHESWDSVGQQTSESVSPCWNSVYASYVRGLQRVKLFQSVQDWETVCSLTIDGLITLAPMTIGGSGLGALRLEGEGPATILTDYAKDRPGKAGMWRSAAGSAAPGADRFTLSLPYLAGLGSYAQSGVSMAEAHSQLGQQLQATVSFPIGSATRRAPSGLTVADLLREAVPTRSMNVEMLNAH